MLTKRTQSKAIANSFINRINNENTTSYAPRLGIWDSSIVNQVHQGQMKDVQKCEGTWKVDRGCPCPPPSAAATPSAPLPGWATYLFGPAEATTDNVTSFSYAVSNGSVYICGLFYNTLNLYDAGCDQATEPLSTPSFTNLTSLTTDSLALPTAFLAKYSAAGKLQWVTKMGGSNTPLEDANSSKSLTLHVDTNGVYVSGTFLGNSPSGDNKFVLYNANPQNLTDAAILPSLTLEKATDICYIAKYNTNGALQWATVFDDDNNKHLPVSLLTYGSYLYVCGMTSKKYSIYQAFTPTSSVIVLPPPIADITTNEDFAGFIIQYDSAAGVANWTTYLKNTATTLGIRLIGMSTNDTGIVLCGSCQSGIVCYDTNTLSDPTTSYSMTASAAGFVVKYTHLGKFDWSTKVDGAPSAIASVTCANGMILVTGHSRTSAVKIFNGYKNWSVPVIPSVSEINSINVDYSYIIAYQEQTGTADPRATFQWVTKIANVDTNARSVFGYSIAYANNFIYAAIKITKELNYIYSPYNTSTDTGTPVLQVRLTKEGEGIMLGQFSMDGQVVWVTTIDGAGGFDTAESTFSWYKYPRTLGGVSVNANEIYMTGVSFNSLATAGNNMYLYEYKGTNNTLSPPLVPAQSPAIAFNIEASPFGSIPSPYKRKYSFLAKYLTDGTFNCQ
jgi:hypothetical protein